MKPIPIGAVVCVGQHGLKSRMLTWSGPTEVRRVPRPPPDGLDASFEAWRDLAACEGERVKHHELEKGDWYVMSYKTST